jgi:cytochrome c biogenesis protein CcmG/thiol:disulfide interchange protein DsbE
MFTEDSIRDCGLIMPIALSIRALLVGLLLVAASGCNKDVSPPITAGGDQNAAMETPEDTTSSMKNDSEFAVVFSALSGKKVDWGIAPKKELYAEKDVLNQPAPDLFVESWLGDTPELQGKFVLIDFWATWCPPCRQVIPELNDIAKQFSKELIVVGLSDESADKVREMSEPVIEYYSAVDTQSRTKDAIGVQGIPHALLIDPSGTVCWQGFPLDGDYPLDASTIQACFDRYNAAE